MLPGMIFNGTKRVAYTDALSGKKLDVPAGRLECTMQVGLCGAACCAVLASCHAGPAGVPGLKTESCHPVSQVCTASWWHLCGVVP